MKLNYVSATLQLLWSVKELYLIFSLASRFRNFYRQNLQRIIESFASQRCFVWRGRGHQLTASIYILELQDGNQSLTKVRVHSFSRAAPFNFLRELNQVRAVALYKLVAIEQVERYL